MADGFEEEERQKQAEIEQWLQEVRAARLQAPYMEVGLGYRRFVRCPSLQAAE